MTNYFTAELNTVPTTWKLANVLPFKKGDETGKYNYRPISLLCVPVKLMESCVGSILTTHITKHDSSGKNQWEYVQLQHLLKEPKAEGKFNP